MEFAPVYPHGSPQQIADDVFVVRGSIKMNPLIRITRNMVVVRHEGELTLVNPVRMSEAGLAELDGLGKVTNLLRLGAFHGIDDPFYMQRYQPTFWSQAGGTTYIKPNIDRELSDDCELPFPGSTFFAFDGTIQPEGAIVLDKGPGLLLTTDAIQHYGDYSYSNLLARMMLPFLGFSKATLVGPIWLKVMTPEGASLKDNFTRCCSYRSIVWSRRMEHSSPTMGTQPSLAPCRRHFLTTEPIRKKEKVRTPAIFTAARALGVMSECLGYPSKKTVSSEIRVAYD